MALQLQEQGQQIAFVGMLDTLGPPDPINSMKVSLLGRLRYRSQTFKFLPPREKAAYVSARVGDFARRGWRRVRRIPPPPPPVTFDWLKIGIAARADTPLAETTYSPRTFDGRITYFLSEASTEPHDYDWRAGWHRHATRGLEVIKVPGDHASMLLEPAVHVLAIRLKAALEKAQREALPAGPIDWRPSEEADYEPPVCEPEDESLEERALAGR
jgi:thioesterase domain-containing protein